MKVPVIIVFLCLLALIREDARLTELKRRYEILKQVLPADKRWEPIRRSRSILVGTTGKYDGAIGSNVNKGYEIYICLGDDVNSGTYVLLHELAHLTVEEYDHSEAFWKNFSDLRKIAAAAGLYTQAGQREYCGEQIHD
jgi:hypothetical protein